VIRRDSVSSLKPYPEYVDSGVPWLGEIPEHWALRLGRACFKFQQDKNTGQKENTVLSLSYGKIIKKSDDKMHGLVPESLETYQIVNPGNLIIRATDLQNDKRSLRVGKVSDRGIITSAYICLVPNEAFGKDFIFYYLHALDLMKVFYGMGSGLRQNLEWSDFKKLAISIPPRADQLLIARYLDHKTAQIDRYIRAKKRLVALLEEQKRVIIDEAVTGKIDVRTGKPHAKYVDSGVEWLGMVPEGWRIEPAKSCYYEVDDRSESGNEELLSVSHITGVTPRSQKNITMFMAASNVGHKLCRSSDLVINTMWAWMGALGVASQIGIVSPSYGVYRRRNDCPLIDEFADQLLRARCYIDGYRLNSIGIRSSRLRLYPIVFLRLKVLVPSRAEQQAIAQYLARKTGAILLLQRKAQSTVETLNEFRSRLISDVVTGKLDVREAAARLPDLDATEPSIDEGELVDEEELEEELEGAAQ
jgi:type I restriction enzyme, S subunit